MEQGIDERDGYALRAGGKIPEWEPREGQHGVIGRKP